MPVYALVEEVLRRAGVPYRLLDHPRPDAMSQSAKIPLQRLAKVLILEDRVGLVMAILPASHDLDLASFNHMLARTLQLASPGQYGARLGEEFRSGAIPPLELAFGIPVAIDASLLEGKEVYFEVGAQADLIQLGREDFLRLNPNAQVGRFSNPIIDLSQRACSPTDLQVYRLWREIGLQEAEGKCAPLLEIKRRVEKLTELPAMPALSYKLLVLRSDPEAGPRELARVIELDPSLSAQLVRVARSPLYGTQNRVATVQDAIIRVLGFDMALHMALGVSLGKSFRIPSGGPLGLHAFWRHAVYGAALVKALVECMPARQRPNQGLAYLCGLLHDFGFLLLGHLFQQEFYILNKVVAEHPTTPITDIESHVLGVRHDQLGAWLMEAWDMPQEITASTGHHHDLAYHGRHGVYVHLVQLSNHYLGQYGVGDERDCDTPVSELLGKLGIGEDAVTAMLERTLGRVGELDAMVRHLAA